MKPVVTMDEKPTIVFPTVDQTENVKDKSKRKLLIVSAVVGVVFLVIIVGVTLGSFYLGMNAQKDSYKEAWLTYKVGENKTIVKERVIVKEEEKEVDIRRPGIIRMVIDYKKNVLVMQYDDELKDDEDIFCYVYDYEPGMFGSLEDGADAVDAEETTVTVPGNSEKFKFVSTGETVPIEELSPSAREMCFGANIVKVHRTENTETQSGCQTDWIQMRGRVTRRLIWIQTVCKYFLRFVRSKLKL